MAVFAASAAAGQLCRLPGREPPVCHSLGRKSPHEVLPTSLRQLPGGLGEPDTEGLAHRLPAHIQRGAAELGVLAPLRSRAPSPGSASSGQAERGSA